MIIYTDGSASAGTKDGGAAAIIACTNLEAPVASERILLRGAAHTSSFEEELAAMISAVRWCVEHQSPATRIVIATDSQSLCQALLGHSPVVDELKGMLDLCCGSISIQWIPGHADIPGNEMADMDAKKAATICNDPPRGTSFRGVLPAINNAIADAPPSHPRTALVYSNISRK